ncbi:MAG: hormogonium polysaccharide biosynthesis protein HpsJ [Microcoleaceae cyanobacterium]
MKATTSRSFSSTAAQLVKLIGGILILSAVVDYLILLFPPQLMERAWQLNTASQLVDRGIVPMVGMALVIIGFWMDSAASGGTQRPTKLFADLRFWISILASLLGLLYLLLFPLHLNNTRLARAEALSQIGQQASQAETQLDSRLGSNEFQQQVTQRKTQLRSQFSQLLQNEQQLDELLASGNLPEPVKAVLEEAKTNPAALDQFLEQQADTLPDQLKTQIQERKQELEQEAKVRSLKSSLQTGLSSLLLSIGYIVIGWTGLKTLGILGGRRKQPIG